MRQTPDPLALSTGPIGLLAVALAVALNVLPAVLAPPALHACSCMPPASAPAELTKADAVFVGRAVSVVTEEREMAEIRSFFSQHRVTFELQRVWKGLPEGETVTVTTAADGAACGYAFEEGKTYLVFAYEVRQDRESEEGGGEDGAGDGPEDRQLTTNLCTRNAPLRRAGEDVAALGEPLRTVAR